MAITLPHVQTHRWTCHHRGERDYYDSFDGTVIETCRCCRAQWVVWPGGRRVRARVTR